MTGYQHGTTLTVATSAERATIRALENRLARASHHADRLEATITRLNRENKLLRERRHRELREDDRNAARPYYQTLTPEQLFHRHGDSRGAARLMLAAAEAHRHAV